MDFDGLNTNLQHVVNCIGDVVNDNKYKVSQYELYVDLMLSFTSSDIFKSRDSIENFPDAIVQLNSKLLLKYNLGCEIFDNANPLECFQPKYSINKAPSFCDYAELYVSILAMECLLIQTGTLDAKYSGHCIKREFVSILGRFLFLYNSYIKKVYLDEITSYPDIFVQIFCHAIRITCCLTWTHEDRPLLRVFLLNLFDAMSEPDKTELLSLVNQALSENKIGNMIVSEDNMLIVQDTIDRYYSYISIPNKITEIKVSWLYAYIYKKRFGFIFCKKFTKCVTPSSLPYKFLAYTPAFKNASFVQVYNGPKVVLFEAGENKRSSEYIPTESTAFYNVASGMFE